MTSHEGTKGATPREPRERKARREALPRVNWSALDEFVEAHRPSDPPEVRQEHHDPVVTEVVAPA